MTFACTKALLGRGGMTMTSLLGRTTSLPCSQLLPNAAASSSILSQRAGAPEAASRTRHAGGGMHVHRRRGGGGAAARRTFASYPKVRPRRVRVISMDVTGTMVSFSGKLASHYGDAARRCGIVHGIDDAVKNGRIESAFKVAYDETCERHPCFGGTELTAKEWWRICVLRSFELAGVRMTSDEQERVFQRVYSVFGSHAPYASFPDAMPFLRWAQRNGIICGVLSNADERYGDSILPMLGLIEGLTFMCFSKELGVEKPHPLAFNAVLDAAKPWLHYDVEREPLLPSDVLHIGNDFRKDFVGARQSGMHAVLLDRYHEEDQADEWRRRGAPVFRDLIDVVEFLGRSNCALGVHEEDIVLGGKAASE